MLAQRLNSVNRNTRHEPIGVVSLDASERLYRKARFAHIGAAFELLVRTVRAACPSRAACLDASDTASRSASGKPVPRMVRHPGGISARVRLHEKAWSNEHRPMRITSFTPSANDCRR